MLVGRGDLQQKKGDGMEQVVLESVDTGMSRDVIVLEILKVLVNKSRHDPETIDNVAIGATVNLASRYADEFIRSSEAWEDQQAKEHERREEISDIRDEMERIDDQLKQLVVCQTHSECVAAELLAYDKLEAEDGGGVDLAFREVRNRIRLDTQKRIDQIKLNIEQLLGEKKLLEAKLAESNPKE